MKIYKMVLLGFGNAGQALASLLLEKRSELQHRLRPADRFYQCGDGVIGPLPGAKLLKKFDQNFCLADGAQQRDGPEGLPEKFLAPPFFKKVGRRRQADR